MCHIHFLFHSFFAALCVKPLSSASLVLSVGPDSLCLSDADKSSGSVFVARFG